MSTNNYSFVGDQRQRLSDQRKATQTAPVEPATQAAPTATDAATLTDREQIAQSIDQQLAQIDSTFNANKDRWAAEKRKNTYNGSMGMFAQPSQFTVAALPEEQKQLEAARMELAKAKKALNTYTENDQAQDVRQGKEQGFFEEIGTGLKNTTFGDVASIFTLGYSDTQNTSKINAALRKASQGGELTDIERSMVEAVRQTQKAQGYVQDNGGGTILSSIGEGIPTTAGYMLETAVFGGNLLSTARNAATKGAAAFGKAVLKEAAVEAVRTPFRGSMTSKIVDLDAGQYSVQDDDSVVKDDPSFFVERLWKGYASTFAEGFSERIGNVIPSNVVGRGLGKVVPKLIGAKAGAAVMDATKTLADNTKPFRDFMRKTTGYNGTVDEFLEEEFNSIVEPLLTLEPERIKDNFTLKNQAVTLGSVAVMGATMHTMSLPSTVAITGEKLRTRNAMKKAISSIEIPILRQEVYNATKRGAAIEDKAKDIANLDWANMSVADRANTVDAFNKSVMLDAYNGFELSRNTEEMTAQKIQAWNVIYQQSANTDTGAIEELADEQDNRYLLLAGSLEDQGTDETLFVRNAQTGMTEQIGRSSVRRVGEAETYDSGLRKIVEQSAKQASEQILDDQSTQEDQDAQEIGVQPIAYNVGDNVTLADGRQGQFLGYHNDGSNIAQVAFVDQQTGEQESAEVPKSHIVGFAYQDDVSQAESAQELPNVEQSEQSENAQQEVPSENVQREIPTTKDGAPDYDAMPADMYLEEYSKIASRGEALDDLRGEKIALEKQIKRLQSSNNATSRNTKIANRAKVSGLQTKVDDITRVLHENMPEQSSETQIEQIPATKLEQVPRNKVTLKEFVLDFGGYVSIEDYILRDIASGLKFRWSDDGVSRGLATELGFKGSEQERKSRIGILKNDGVTIDRYAESILGLLGNSIPAFNVDEQDIRSAVIDVLGSVSSPAQAAAKVRALHADSFDEQANDYYLGELEKYKLEVAEYDAALDIWVNELSEADFAEIDALFESELLTLRDQNTSNDGYNQTNPRRTAVAQDAIAEISKDQSRQGGDNSRGGDQKIDPRVETKESGTRQDSQRVGDPIFSAQTQEQKYEAVKDYVEQLNQLSGADAVAFSKLEQLPDTVAVEFEAQWRAEPNQETPGVTIGTKVYIYAPHIKSITDLETVFNHEVAAHRNVLLALGQDRKAEVELYSAVVDGIGVPKMLQLIEDPVFSELADLYFGTSTQSSKIELGKEFVGYFTEKHFNKKEYSNVGAGKLSLNLSEKITIEDVTNILNTANRKGNEQRITIENSRNGSGQVVYEKDDTRNMGQDRAGQTSDLAGRGSGTSLAPENTASDLSGIQKNPTHSKNGNGGSTESDSNSGTEIRQENVRGVGGDEQTAGSTDARSNSADKTKELKNKNNVWSSTTDIQPNGKTLPSEQSLGAETNDSPSTDGGQDDRSPLEAARQTIQQQPTLAIVGSVDSAGRDNLTTSQSLNLSVPGEQSISEGRIADSGDYAGRDFVDGLRAQVERRADDSSNAGSRADTQVIRRSGDFLVSDKLSIAETLPQLLPDQRKDVLKAEKRFFTGAGAQLETGTGILFTNGTGTGKTYTGLGIAKRFILQGKPDILIVAPTDKVVKDWVKTAHDAFAVELSQLDGVLDQGATQCVTTYANFRQNSAIVNRKFDLVIYDESHYLNQNAAGTRTSVQDKSDQIVLSVGQSMARAQIELASTKPTDTDSQQYYKELERWNGEVLVRAKEIYASRAKVVMLSATPFAYHKSLAYADGLLFTINETFDKEDDSSGYNKPNRWEQFMVSNFGYRMRYNKLTQPENKHSTSMLERLFYDKLVKQGAASGRSIDVPFDYSRDFAVVTSGIGEQIDKGMQAVFADSRLFLLAKAVSAKWSFVKRSQFLEAVKSEGIIPYIDQLLAKKRKVVVFHNFMKENTENPLYFTKLDNKPVEALSERQMSQYKELLKRFSSEASQMSEQDLSDFERLDAQVTARQIHETVGRYDIARYNEQVDIWNNEYAEFADLDFSGIKSPINAFVQHYGGRVALFNGQVSKKTRSDNTVKFNDDNSNVDIILVQRQAGKEGISFHDRSGAHQRVLINLGLPTAPTDAIQIEGRIYRIGLKSNAAFIYPIINTSFERFAFAQTIASRSKTAENLALGSRARRLESAFKDGYQNAVDVSDLDIDQLGVGTKITEAEEQITPYQESVALYATNAKNSKGRSKREGVDYFATPEPVGFKMVEWLGLEDNDRVLEPSAGHGAIARFFPDNVRAVAIEPSNILSSKLSINTNATLIQSTFEDYYIGNKFDRIVMNPPFGIGGKTAIEHLEKAYKHLSSDGGRVIAIIPRGASTEKHFDNFLYGVDANGKLTRPDAHLAAEILLPSSTFKNAGTAVSTRIVIIDKIVSQSPCLFTGIDLTSAKTTQELFDQLEDIQVSALVPTDIRYREVESNNPVEIEQIRQQAIERGDFLKAPNGEQTNLAERQWLQVRTAAFKEWFGDWERAARIEKLHKAKSVEITGNEIAPSDDLKQYKRNALEYGKALRGEYVNKDTGEKIVLHRSAVKEVLNHDYKDFEHLQSIAAIPQIIEQSIYITTASNEDVFTNPDVASYDYYVCGLNVGDLDYTVRAVVATKSDGKRYYDHKLSAIEKGKLIEKLTPYAAFAPSGLSSTVGSEESTPFRPADKSGETSKISPVSDFKDKRLISILQTNSSKVVDANGEPMVVYHGSDSDFYEFSHDKISNQEGSFFFAQNIEDAEGYSSGALIEAFVNLRNPANFEDLPLEVLRLNDKKAIVERLKPEGYDGWVEGLKDGWGEISAFNPNQIKSATENTGDFSSQNNDIRYSDQSLLAETQSQHEYEQNKAKTYVNAEKRKAQVAEQLQKLTAKFGVETVIANSAKELPQSVRYRTRNARFGGLYDKQDGKVYFVASEIRDADDATATFLHEVVSHKGIDALMGREGANQFYASVFDSLPQEERARLLAKYGDKVLAGDELVARMAEGNVTPSVMQRVIAAVRKFFRETLGFSLTISDNDIRYVLWKSKNNLERASTLDQVFSVIERDRALRSELYPPNRSLMDNIRQVATESRMRVISQEVDQKANADFNADLSRYASSLMKANEYLHVGLPSGALSQILPRLPIVVKQGVITKAIAKKHNLTIDSLENLPAYLSNPIFIFSRDDRSVGVLTDIADKEGKNTCVAIRINTLMQNGKEFVEVNDIATIHGRDAENIISPIVHNNSLIWADKRKGLNWLSSAQLNGQEIDNQNLISATKIVENHQNNTLNDLRYRTVKPFVATDKKDNEYLRVSGKKGGWGSNAIQIQEAVQDETIKVHLLQKEIKRRGGEITALTNVYEAINHRDSIADAQMAKYGRQYIKPFVGLISALKEKGVEYGDVSTYLLAKHSIERHLSGIDALSEDSSSDWTLENTSEIVETFEAKLTRDELDSLWKTWHKATERIVDIAVQSGRMSLESKEGILARWKYYVPLRGKDWEFEGEDNLADLFYVDRSVGRGKSPSKKVANIKALGRTSKAADPISVLQNMANSEIYLSAVNNVNRSLLRLVNQYQDMTDLFELKERWYVKKGESWYASDDRPSSEEISASWIARVLKRKLERELATTVDADQRAEKEGQIEELESQITVSRHERDARGYNGLDPKAAEVIVMKDGVRYIIELKDPEVAQAINGNSGSVQRWLSRYPGRVTRVMSQLSTSKNPAFILPNLLRDFQQAGLYNFVDQDGNTLGYMRNMTASWATLHRNITDKASPLTVAEIGGYNLLDADHRKILAQMYGKARVKDTMYDLFVMNGGETGCVHILEPAEYQRKLEKEIRTVAKGDVAGKGWKALNNGVDYLANMSENAVRFATFMSQIERESNVFDAVSYAKNITVNFNRKGKYSKGIGALFMFFNAGVQGATNTYSLWGNKNDRSESQITAQRARFVLANSMLAAIGYISAALIYEMLSSMEGDEGQEFQISEYERRTNLVIPAGTEKGYIKIPIPILFRPFYSLGVMTNDWVNGKIEASDVMGVFSQSVVDAVSPLQVGYSLQTDNGWSLAKPFIPSSVKPLAEIGYNQNFLGRAISREAIYNPDTPDSELGQKNVNKIALAVSRWLNKLGGGNEVTAAGIDEQGRKDLRNWLDISPSTLEHIVTSYTGGVGKMINETYVTLTGDQREARKIPIANRFYGEVYEKDPSREYYDIKKNIERVNRNNKKVEELGVRSALFTNKEFSTKKTEYEKYETQLKQVERRIRSIKEKLGQVQFGSQEYDLLENQIDKLQRQFIKQYNDQRN